MKSCKNCTKKNTCCRATGVIFGGCNVEFEPVEIRLESHELSSKDIISLAQKLGNLYSTRTNTIRG
jgi:hypothetical protein